MVRLEKRLLLLTSPRKYVYRTPHAYVNAVVSLGLGQKRVRQKALW